MNAAFGNKQRVPQIHSRGERFRDAEIHFKCFEIPVVHANERRLERQRAIELIFVVHLHQCRQARRAGERVEVAELRVIECWLDAGYPEN